DGAHARTSLRNALYVLRQAMGDGVIRTRGDDDISVDPAAMFTDVGAVWSAIRDGRTEDALTGLAGELLAGLYPVDSDGFLRWLDEERARLRASVAASAIARCDVLERNGRVPEALALARRAMEIQRDDETLVRRVMSMHETVGDRAGALALFENYRTRLAAEFNAEPAPETTALAAQFRTRASSSLVRVPSPKRVRSDERGMQASSVVGALPALSETPAILPDRAPRFRSRRRTIALGAGITATAAVVALVTLRREVAIEPPTIGRSTPVTADDGLQVQAAISPNGRLVAYARGNGNRLRIFVQKIGGGAAWPLTDDSLSFEQLPRWAPDNDQLLFLSGNDAYVAPAVGGSPTIVARGRAGDGKVRSATWSLTGDSLAIVRNDSLIMQPLHGTGSRLVGRGKQLHACMPSPNGKWFACESGNWIAFEPGPLFGNEAPSALVLFASSGSAPVDLTGHDFQHESAA
ncbi:MAG TPA: BTAD domain-containing putative transcriptional regulator, partial [Gemmatimonas sp.]|nr:BTAD domain-containing putative transcriptional regulator [Gemmatimonas sp.]